MAAEQKTIQAFSKKTRILGIIVIVFAILGLSLTLLSPFLPNSIQAWRNDQILQQLDQNIYTYRTGDISIQFQYINGTPIPNRVVGYNLTRHDFLFGSLFSSFNKTGNVTDDAIFNTYFSRIFNYATLPFYWTYWEPSYKEYPAEVRINQTITYCQEHNITMKGHPIFWPLLVNEPDWISTENKTLLMEYLYNRVVSTVGKYRGIIDIWDYLGEFTHWEKKYYGLDKTEFMLQAYKWGKALNPDATLLVNDFFTLGHGGASGDIYWFYENLQKRGGAYNVFGMQAHQFETDWFPAADMYESLNGYMKLGVPIHITEFHSTSLPVPITNSHIKGLWNEQKQAEFAREFYRVMFSHPAVEAITWWGFSDSDDKQGILDENYNPKPVFWALDQLINQEWHSEGIQTTGTDGRIVFRGYYGTYNLTLTGLPQDVQIIAKNGESNQFVIQI